tara:strand:- start:189 stop:1253 length:1065 start_codon:yes stop_codon:yes gene_type:complete
MDIVQKSLTIKDNEKLRTRAPMRISFAGGGTDIDHYFRKYNGAVINATVNKFAYVEIVRTDREFVAESLDFNKILIYEKNIEVGKIPKELRLHLAVYEHIIRKFNNSKHLYIKLSSYVDAPIGSGLGSSSTLVVAMIKAFNELLLLGLDDYSIAGLAHQIEREDCGIKGGKQDQYSAAFGGINFIEFNKANTIVNTLKIKNWFKCELESSLVLHFTGVSRLSSNVIEDQLQSVLQNNETALNSLHEIKKEVYLMKNYLLNSDICGIKKIINEGWSYKKKTSTSVSNDFIDKRIKLGFDNGAEAAKVSGAGGGGFILFMCDPKDAIKLRNRLLEESTETFFCNFNDQGAQSWIVN